MSTNDTRKRGQSRPEADSMLAALLAGGATRDEAAAATGLSTKTVARRLSDPDFRRMVAECRDRITGVVLDRTAALAGKAMDTLEALLDDNNPHVRLGTARTVLMVGAAYGERSELAGRLEALEAVLAARWPHHEGRKSR